MSRDNSHSGMSHNALTAETTIEGNIISQKDIRIDGVLKGELKCQGKVIIGDTGQVFGNVSAVTAEIIGHITGNITVTEMLFLKASSVIEGDIQVGRLSIEPGAVLNGKCSMAQRPTE